ncbi:MAG: riboflavin synthase [Armatimonadota bacterium]|nr:riboflavin synthase [Armatimonadota bacterium]
MFTGIVQGMGVVVGVEDLPSGRRLTIEAPSLLGNAQIGESIAVNGVCLTITRIEGNRFQVDVGAETLRRTTLGKLQAGAAVNLERPLTLTQPLGGHIVQGHVDGVGVVVRKVEEGPSVWMEIGAPPEIMRYIVEKGSVAVDGVSLTVASRKEGSFAVSLIPHTLAVTTLGIRKVGDEVNIEVDILAKYVEQLLRGQERSREGG